MSRPRITLPELLADPFATLAATRRRHWIADTDPDDAVVVVSHDRVRELLADPRLRASFVDFLRAVGIERGPFHDWMALSPLNRDGAEHQRWRTLLSRAFTPRSVERLRPFLRAAAHTLIDGFAARGGCDVMAELADVFPSLGLCELIGVPVADRERFRGWANTIGLGFNPILIVDRIGEIDAALTALLAYTRELAARRRAEPRDDLVTRLAQAGDEAGWSDEEVHGSIAGLVFAGHETTKNQLGWTVAVLAERPALWDAVGTGALAARDVIEEVLRYRSTVTSVGRAAAESFTHAGERIPAGATVFLSLWGADHDATVYPRPDEVAPAANAGVPHFAFGHGAHFCLGAALARAELQECLTALTERLECPRLEPGAVWKPPLGITGPEVLPITFRQRSAVA
ncbi:cytochrome P450 [bacterium]|nr:cytochrome P450 [bacterium]